MSRHISGETKGLLANALTLTTLSALLIYTASASRCAAQTQSSAVRKPEMVQFTNPVNDQDMPDPGVLLDDGHYWMTHTMGHLPCCPLWGSDDLVHWHFVTHLLDAHNAPTWVQDRYWAPELHKVRGQYILLFTSGSKQGKLCIGSAVASHVTGPYRTSNTPLLEFAEMGVIDPTLFEDEDGRVYLFWKDDANAVGKPCHIYVQEMSHSNPGEQFATGSSPTVLLTSRPDGWENGIVEGPEMVKHNGWYYLFYSGSGYSSNYAEGVARSRNILGPYEKYRGNPILKANDAWVNPGHGAFIKDHDGTLWHLYHAYHNADRGKGRVQLLDRVIFSITDAWPRIGADGTPTISAQSSPKSWR